jgi:hypothetical protein
MIPYQQIPKGVSYMKGQVEFIDEIERRVWTMGFYSLARQKLQDTRRWNNKQGVLRNILLLTPAEQERLISAMNVKTYWARADKTAKTKRSLIAGAKALLVEYNRLTDQFFEGKIREPKARGIEDILNER